MLRLQKIMPGFGDLTRQRKQIILDNFEEVQYPANEQKILEKEGFETKNIYWLEKGEIFIY
jgi:hypothetical protein